MKKCETDIEEKYEIGKHRERRKKRRERNNNEISKKNMLLAPRAVKTNM